MYYDQTGNEWKKFNTADSAGVLFLKKLNIPLAIITGEDTEIVKRRAEKLEIDYLFQGVNDKLKKAVELSAQLNISLKDTAYIGDDIGDIDLLKEVGLSASPQNAPFYIKNIVDYITLVDGGEGAFRDFVLMYLKISNKTEIVLNK